MRASVSDIHLDPMHDGYQLRFRIDGALVDIRHLEPSDDQHMVRAFRSHAGLEPGFALVPQDGRVEFLYETWAQLAELLAKITPGKLTKSFRATGGTEAVEIALQAAMSHTKRHKFVSIEGSWHSLATMSVGASDFRKHYKNLLPNCHKIKPPLDGKAADQLEKLLRRKDVAAFIMEPVICNLGVLIPEQEFMTRVQQLCRKNGTLLIMDEVATGFGRTGKLFASEHFGVQPDILCLAKAITGGRAGLGATVTTAAVAKSMEWEFSLYSTYGWHPLSVEAAIATIRYMVKHKRQLLDNVAEIGAYFLERLSRMKFKSPAKIRAKGLAIGIKFGTRNYASELLKKCRSHGLLLSELDDKTLTLFPPLTINRKVAKKGLDILEQCL